MKRLIIAILLASIPAIYTAQNTSQAISKKVYMASPDNEENKVEIFIEVEIEEYFQKNILKVNINTGEKYKSLISDKRDIKMLEQLIEDTKNADNIPDLLTYFSEEGFEIIHFSAFMMNDAILNKIVFSRKFTRK